MVLHQFPEEFFILIIDQIIKTYSGTDKYFFHFWNLPQFPEQGQVIRVINVQVFTGSWKQALFLRAYAFRELLLTGRMPEICRRPSHVMDIALKVLIFRHKLRFPDEGFVASRLDNPSLMESQRTEIAAAETSPAAYQGKLYFADSRHASERLIAGMISAHVRQSIDCIHFLLAQGLCRRVLHHVELSVIQLCQPFPGKRIGIAVSTKVISFTAIPLFKASAISTIERSPMP